MFSNLTFTVKEFILKYTQDRLVKYKFNLTDVLNSTIVELQEQALYFRFRGFLNILEMGQV